MKQITRVDPSRQSFDIHPDLSVTARERQPGPPARIAGMTVGIVAMDGDAPHGGEAYIISKGGWHVVHVLEPAQFLHITPGPNGDHRP